MYDSIKYTMLESAVNGIINHRDVKTQVAQFRAQMGIDITYEQYCTLVLSDAQAYDAQHVTKATSRGARRSFYNITIYYESTDHYICESYNIDSPILQLNDSNNINKEPNTKNINSENNQEC